MMKNVRKIFGNRGRDALTTIINGVSNCNHCQTDIQGQSQNVRRHFERYHEDELKQYYDNLVLSEKSAANDIKSKRR